MRELDEKKEWNKVICNQCGKQLRVEQGIVKEGCFHGEVTWGYFSSADGLHQSFDLCEDCYRRMIAGFAVPVTETVEQELL